MARRRPNLTERLAAVLLLIKRGEDWLVPEPIRSAGTAAEIVTSVEWHHDVPFAVRPHNDPRLLTPMAPAEHRCRYAQDTGEIARVRRGARTRAGDKPKRIMPYTAMKATHKRTLAGKVVRRDP
jgi:hypothetical protein